VRDKIMVPVGTTETTAKQLALCSPKVQVFTTGKVLVQAIYVPDKLINFVMQ